MDFQYTVDPMAERPIMLLTDDIGYDQDTSKGIDGAKFLAELLALEAMKPKSIEIWINSAGGVVSDAYSIYSAIIDSKVPVDTKCVGMAASSAAFIFEGGRIRTMNDYSWLMFHNPYGSNDKKVLEVMKDSIIKMIGRSGKSLDDIEQMMKRTTYIYADEAKQIGLCDIVEASDQKNKKRLAQFTEAKDFHREVNLVLNKLFDKPSPAMSNYSKITAKLGLNPEASEDSIKDAIENIMNKAKDEKTGLEGKISDLQKKMDDQKAEYDKQCSGMQEEMDKLTKEKAALAKEKDALNKEKDGVVADKAKAEEELDKMKKEKEDAETAMKAEKAKNMAKDYAKVGRIKDEPKVIDFWTAQLMVDEVMAKEQIESLPLNKIAPVIDKIEPSSKITAASFMAGKAKEYNDQLKKQHLN